MVEGGRQEIVETAFFHPAFVGTVLFAQGQKSQHERFAMFDGSGRESSLYMYRMEKEIQGTDRVWICDQG